jgi:predicted DNA-binding transcriptional regulator YafY
VLVNRVDRLMGILTTLQSHKYVTTERLCEKFGISVRTVYRDIRALDEIGIPVSFENGKGYFVTEGYFLPPVSFTPEEANALVLLSSLADRFGDISVAKHATVALDKIRTVLRSSEKERTSLLGDKIRVLDPDPSPKPFDHLAEIQKAIASSTILQMEYTDAKRQKTRREVEPIGMIYYTEQWHLIAWCWMRNDYRDFIVKQIDGLRSTSKPFRKANHISVDEHIRSWTTLPSPGLP